MRRRILGKLFSCSALSFFGAGNCITCLLLGSPEKNFEQRGERGMKYDRVYIHCEQHQQQHQQLQSGLVGQGVNAKHVRNDICGETREEAERVEQGETVFTSICIKDSYSYSRALYLHSETAGKCKRSSHLLCMIKQWAHCMHSSRGSLHSVAKK